MILRHLLIDWLTLRIPLNSTRLASVVRERVAACLGQLHCYDSEGSRVWSKNILDIDKLRSDSVGLFWQVQGDGKDVHLVIGGSPAALEHGINVFGSLDIRHCANVLIRAAMREFHAILPALEHWQCRRIDITGNYLFPDSATVKSALRMLMLSDGSRRKAGSAGDTDTVTWNSSSDLAKGKAYHKGPQLERLVRKGKVKATQEQIDAAHRLGRLEHTKGARWLRRLEDSGRRWWLLTAYELWKEFEGFFGRLVQGVEVREMNRETMVNAIRDANGITQGRAEAAFTTLRNIREDGFEVVKGYVPHRTFYRHLKYLRAAGVTDADMRTAKVLPFRPVRIVLAQPVGSWDDIARAA
jgi:hypothetical protein